MCQRWHCLFGERFFAFFDDNFDNLQHAYFSGRSMHQRSSNDNTHWCEVLFITCSVLFELVTIGDWRISNDCLQVTNTSHNCLLPAHNDGGSGRMHSCISAQSCGWGKRPVWIFLHRFLQVNATHRHWCQVNFSQQDRFYSVELSPSYEKSPIKLQVEKKTQIVSKRSISARFAVLRHCHTTDTLSAHHLSFHYNIPSAKEGLGGESQIVLEAIDGRILNVISAQP